MNHRVKIIENFHFIISISISYFHIVQMNIKLRVTAKGCCASKIADQTCQNLENFHFLPCHFVTFMDCAMVCSPQGRKTHWWRDTSMALFLKLKGHFLKMKNALIRFSQILGGGSMPQMPPQFQQLWLCSSKLLLITFIATKGSREKFLVLKLWRSNALDY